MIIEQPEAFKTWLTAVLRPMCDADPAALAKYVLALIKKDKSEEELQKIMVGQLEVFLESETESFVNLVLRTLETQDYITTPVIPNTNPPNPIMVKPTTATTAVTTKETKTIVQPSELPNLNETINGSSSSSTTVTTTTARKEQHESKRDRDLRKSDFDKEERSIRIRSRHRSTSRNRSRSRSWDRSRRSKSRDRDLYRDKRSRNLSNRNKSPPPSTNRRYRRSRSPHTSPTTTIATTTSSTLRRSSRSRSPKYRSRYRNRTPPPIRDRSLTRSRSRSLPPAPRSLSRGERRDSNKESRNNRPDTPTQDSNHGDTDFRLTNTTQSIQSVIVQQQQQQIQQTITTTTTKRRCRDFDEKGYCMRGEMCPFDHGIDPVVLEDSALSTVLTTYNPNNTTTGSGTANNNNNNGNTNGTNDLTQLTSGHPIISGVNNNNGPRIIPTEYNPQAPQIWNRPGFRGPRPINNMPRGPIMGGFPSQPNLQRELIPVPVMDSKPDTFNNNNNNGPNYRHHSFNSNNMSNIVNEHDHIGYNNNNNNSNVNHGNLGKKKSFDFNRLGPRSHHHHHHHHNNNNNNNSNSGSSNNKMNYPTNSSLELRKIPQGLNTITHLNNHFSKFGKPINIQVNYDNDPEAAIITFSSHAEANAAYRSTEAVLNNRFIKVFWHNNNNNNNNNDGKQENIPPRSVKERLGIPSIVPPNTNKVLNLVQSRNSDTVKTNDENIENNNNNNNEITSDKLKTIINNNKDDKAQQAAAIKKNQELLAVKEKIKKNQDEQRKEVLKMKNSLRKRKQELLEKQLSQQKVLIEKMEKLPPGPQRDHIMETIKKTQESIEETKKDLLQSVLTTKTTQQQQSPIVVIKKKEDVQREMLDAELDLITKQQEGADTTEIQKRLIELRAKVALTTSTTNLSSLTTMSTTIQPSIIRGRSNSSGNRIGRRFNPIVNRHLLTKNNLIDNGVKSNLKSVNKAFQKHTVDHRPTRLLISGYEADEQDSVLSHFQSFGEIVDYIVDTTLPSITLNYKTRKEAEMALLKGKHFQDRTLSITWSTSPHIQTTTATTNNATTITTSTTEDTQQQQEKQEIGTIKRTNSNKIPLNDTTTDEDQLIEQHLQGGEGEEDLIGPEISEEALLQDDEEEEEENEDRSWRR